MRKHSNTDDTTQPALRLDGALIESGGRLGGSHPHQGENPHGKQGGKILLTIKMSP